MRELWDAFTAEATYTPYPGSPFEEALLVDHVALVAEETGTPIGSVYADVGSEHFGYVFGLYVRPEQRGRGHARELMRAVARLLLEHGKPYVLLSVDTPNAAARALYERLGFTDAARMLRAETAAIAQE